VTTGAVRLARAEAHKLRRPLTMSVFLTVIGFVLANVSIAEMNGQQAMGQLRAMDNARACATAQERPSPACRSGERGRQLAEAMSSVTSHAQQDVATAAVPQRPSGGLLLAADMWATLVGGFAIALLAGGHVAGELLPATLGTSAAVAVPAALATRATIALRMIAALDDARLNPIRSSFGSPSRAAVEAVPSTQASRGTAIPAPTSAEHIPPRSALLAVTVSAMKCAFALAGMFSRHVGARTAAKGTACCRRGSSIAPRGSWAASSRRWLGGSGRGRPERRPATRSWHRDGAHARLAS
jgi:hypothetical protein